MDDRIEADLLYVAHGGDVIESWLREQPTGNLVILLQVATMVGLGLGRMAPLCQDEAAEVMTRLADELSARVPSRSRP